MDLRGDLLRIVPLGGGRIGTGIVKGNPARSGPVSVRVKARCPRCPAAGQCHVCEKEFERALRRLRGARIGVLLAVSSALSTTAEVQAAGDAISRLLTELELGQAVWLGPERLRESVSAPGLRFISLPQVQPPRWVGQTGARHTRKSRH